jgi:hypothetical protein
MKMNNSHHKNYPTDSFSASSQGGNNYYRVLMRILKYTSRLMRDGQLLKWIYVYTPFIQKIQEEYTSFSRQKRITTPSTELRGCTTPLTNS